LQDRWVNNERIDMSAFIPTKWASYLFTSGLVLITVVCIALYAPNGMTLLIGCSIVCLAALALSFYLIF